MRNKSFSAVFLLTFVWSMYFIAVKLSVNILPAYLVGVYIRLFTLFALLVYMGVKGIFKDLFETRAVLPRLLLIGLLGFGLDVSAFIGMKMTTVSNAALLLKLDIVFASLITIIFLKKKLTKYDWIATLITLSGVLVVLKVDIMHFKFTGVGDLLLILSSLIVTVNAFIIKSVQQSPIADIKDEVIAFFNNFVTLLLFTATLFLLDQQSKVEIIFRNPQILVPLTIGGIGQTMIYILYYYGLKRMQVWLVKLILLLIPVISTIVAFLFLNESITQNQVWGMFLVIAGAAIAILKQANFISKSTE